MKLDANFERMEDSFEKCGRKGAIGDFDQKLFNFA